MSIATAYHLKSNKAFNLPKLIEEKLAKTQNNLLLDKENELKKQKENIAKKILLKVNSGEYNSHAITEISKLINDIDFKLTRSDSKDKLSYKLSGKIVFENEASLNMLWDIIKITDIELNKFSLFTEKSNNTIFIETLNFNINNKVLKNDEKNRKFLEEQNKKLLEKNIINMFCASLLILGIYDKRKNEEEKKPFNPIELIKMKYEDAIKITFLNNSIPANYELENLMSTRMTYEDNNTLEFLTKNLVSIKYKTKNTLKFKNN